MKQTLQKTRIKRNYRVAEVVPLKQGLKHIDRPLTPEELQQVAEVVPLKQGLKLISAINEFIGGIKLQR